MEVLVATQRQIESARINGAKSRGPKTPAGKRRSSLNACKHGLTSRIMAPGPESVAAFQQLFAEYTADFRPASPAEAYLAGQMAVAMFRLNQVWAAETEIWSRALARYESFPMPERLALAFGAECTALMSIQRYESRFERQYELALTRLLAARKVGTTSEKSFLQNEPEPFPQAAKPRPTTHNPLLPWSLRSTPIMPTTTAEQSARVMEASDFNRLFGALRNRGYRIQGPTTRDGAIVYEELESPADLPAGWTEEQNGGTYRLKKRKDGALFGFNVGLHSWKKFLHPPVQRLWEAKRVGKLIQIERPPDEPPKMAFLGVRSCDLHAIAIQDKVLTEGLYVDTAYAARRHNTLIVAVNCSKAGGTCFCVSMNTGPKATTGFDIALTEVLDHDHHYFVAEAASPIGHEILDELALPTAKESENAAAGHVVARAAAHMGRTMDTAGIKELLYANYEHPRWENVAARCLNCANCTLVCPTCFCTTVEDNTDLTGASTERVQKWDSCFTMQYSYIHGGSIRATAKARYRQWMTHKLATWFDQFGSSGCTGCGRCITWCPVAIDITEEVHAIRETDKRNTTRKATHGITGALPAPASVLP